MPKIEGIYLFKKQLILLLKKAAIITTASNNGCSGVDLSKMWGDFIGDISVLEMFEESADAVL